MTVKCRNCNTEYDRAKSAACPTEWCRSTSIATTGKVKQKKLKRPKTQQQKDSAKLRREYNEWVKIQLAKHPRCVVYPYMGSDQIHHIARGCHRKSALMEECATVTVSKPGHFVMEAWPIAKQLAAKLCASPEQAAEIDLERFNEIRGRSPNAITLADLSQYLELKKGQ